MKHVITSWLAFSTLSVVGAGGGASCADTIPSEIGRDRGGDWRSGAGLHESVGFGRELRLALRTAEVVRAPGVFEMVRRLLGYRHAADRVFEGPDG